MPGKVVSETEWLEARRALLEKEKEATRAADKLAAERRELPMVEITKNYTFLESADPKKGDTTTTKVTLLDLFRGKRQLIVYHFMFSPDKDKPCTGCAFMSDHLPDARLLAHKDTALAVVSRASVEQIEAFRKRAGWTFPWVSSSVEGNTFNYDFHATVDEKMAPAMHNFEVGDGLRAKYEAKFGDKWQSWIVGDQPGATVFFRDEQNRIYMTYSTWSRGMNSCMSTHMLLDMTPLGRQDESGMPPFLFELGEDGAKKNGA